MKTLKKISIYLIVSLTVLVCVEKDCLLFPNHSQEVIEIPSNESKADNTLISAIDLYDVDVTIAQNIYDFSLKYLPNERVVISDFLFPQNIYYSIWQPPKIS